MLPPVAEMKSGTTFPQVPSGAVAGTGSADVVDFTLLLSYAL